MSSNDLRRTLPTVTVVALLCLAAAAPQAPQMPAPPPVAAPCTDYSHAGGGGSVLSFVQGDGLIQPLPEGFTAVGCSLSVSGGYYTTEFTSVREWDPTALAPDPATVALRTEEIDPSAFISGNGFAFPWLLFVPPIVTRSLLGVAEPPRTTIAVQVTSSTYPFYATSTAKYDPEGSADMPAVTMVAGGGTHSTPLGSHPVVAHALCSGDDDLQSLRIAQSVRSTNVVLSDRPDEIVQAFRVPEAVDLRWIELAIAVPAPPPPTTIVGIVDPAGAPAPPTSMPPTLVEAVFEPSTFTGYDTFSTTPTWASHLDFDRSIRLQPGRDYWLYLRSASPQQFFGRLLTGSEGGDFSAGVKGFYSRALATDEWTPAAGKVLAFKVVGRPVSGVTVPPSTGGFRMQVAPNPAAGIARVTWSGAVAPVRFEVFDARGRHVASGSGGAAGTWTWGVAGARRLASGVYFVVARDSENRRVVQRFVLVR